MPWFNCKFCNNHFYSPHSTAKYCSRSCSGKISGKISKVGKSKISIPTEEMLNKLKEIAEILGKTPSTRDLDMFDNAPHCHTYVSRFGSWQNAILAAGLPFNLPYSYPPSYNKTVGFSLRFKILQRDNFRCQYCGGTPTEGYFLQVDHVIPVSKGGLTIEENLVTACWICNVGKNNTLIQ